GVPARIPPAKPAESPATAPGSDGKVALHKPSTGYYNLNVRGVGPAGGSAVATPPPDSAAGGAQAQAKLRQEVQGRKDQQKQEHRTEELQDKEKAKPASREPDAKGDRKYEVSSLPGEPIAAQQPKQQPDPQAAQRKIIRTGELEFEVDVFDDTVDQINKLIVAIPGAFVSTNHSQKLENRKCKGSLVVRMPPENLAKFVR